MSLFNTQNKFLKQLNTVVLYINTEIYYGGNNNGIELWMERLG